MTLPILTTASTVLCPHGGTVNLSTGNASVKAESSLVLLESDQHTVSGCPFQVPLESGTGTRPEPCVKVKWQAGASQCKVDAIPVLLQTSVGICYNAKQSPQGTAIIANAQQQAKGI